MDDKNDIKVFTAQEANHLIPQLTLWIQELQQKRDEILSLEVEIDAQELIADKPEESLPSQISRLIEKYNKVVTRFYEIVDQVHATGCYLKDIDMGLVDFYSHYQGRVVYLCWKLGEPEVGFWHDIGQGYITRQPYISNPDKSSDK